MPLSQMNGIPKRQDNFLSEIKLTGGNGHGSTGTKVRCYTTLVYQRGSALSYLPNTTLGDSIRINEPGIYHFIATDQFNNGNDNVTGLVINSTVAQLSTNINSLPINQVLDSTSVGFGNDNGNSGSSKVSWTGWLNAGDYIRVQDFGAGTQTDAYDVRLRACKVMVHI